MRQGVRRVMNAENRRALANGILAVCALFAGTLLAAAGGIIDTPDQGDGIAPSFAFRPDAPPESLKDVPIWSELEQMLDNPYALGACPPDATGQPVPGNAQGFPARCTTI